MLLVRRVVGQRADKLIFNSMKKESYSAKAKKLTTRELQKLIREELAKGIPDYAFEQPVDEALRLLADYFKSTLVKHINHSVQDPFSRTKKYNAAARAAASIVNDKEIKKFLDEKMKEKLLIFLDEGR